MFATISKKIRLACGHDPLANLREIMPRLIELKHELQQLWGGSEKGIDQIVPFFNLTSPWQDEGVIAPIIGELKQFDHERYTTLIEELRTLNFHFHITGRDPHGMNRTGPGQEVTEDDVYLGNTHGLWTRTVSFWKKHKNDDMLPIYDVVSRQASDFMEPHIVPMIQIIERLEQAIDQM